MNEEYSNSNAQQAAYKEAPPAEPAGERHLPGHPDAPPHHAPSGDHHHRPEPEHSVRRRAKHHYLWAMQIVTVFLSYLGRSRIVRFITAKLGLDVVVEVTARFGAPAGHRLSSFVAALIAEPRLIAVIVAGIFLLIDLIVIIVRAARRRSRRPQTV